MLPHPYMTKQPATMPRIIDVPATQSSSCSDKKYSSCTDKKYNDCCHPQNHLCSSPSCSTCIDAFLGLPFVDCCNTFFSPSSLSSEADDLVKDKEINTASISGDQVGYPNVDSMQVSPIKSSVITTKSMDECAEHSGTNFDLNKVVQPHALLESSSIYKGADNTFLVSNAGECSVPNVAAGHNASSQAETYSVRQKPQCPTVPTAFDKIEFKGGLLGKNCGTGGSDHFCVPNSTDCRILCLVDECSQTSNPYYPRRHDAGFFSCRKGYCHQFICTTGVKYGSIKNSQLHNNHLDIPGQMTDASAMHCAISDQEANIRFEIQYKGVHNLCVPLGFIAPK